MTFEVKISKKVAKSISKINKDDAKRILDSLQKLEEPFSLPYEKLKGYSDTYRIRVGDYRIIYFVDKANKVVVVLRTDLRKAVYRKL
jgi:mRNA interferase RelE/StbE